MSWRFGEGATANRHLELVTTLVPTAAPLTIGVWCWSDGTANTILCGINAGTSGSADGWRLGINGSSQGQFQIDAGPSTLVTTGNAGFRSGWSWIVAREVSATDHRVSINGGAEASSATSRVPAGLDRVMVGFTQSGLMAEFAVWNITLDLSEAQAPWYGRVQPEKIRRDTLVFHWSLHDNNGLIGHNGHRLVVIPDTASVNRPLTPSPLHPIERRPIYPRLGKFAAAAAPTFYGYPTDDQRKPARLTAVGYDG